MRRHGHLAALLLFLAAFGIFSLPARLHVGDPYTWREEARSLLLRGELSVPEEIAAAHGEPDQYFVQNPRNGLYYSKYGVMNGIMSAVPLWFEARITGKVPPWDSLYRRLFLGLHSVVISLLIAWLLFRLCLQYGATPEAAVLYVLLSVFCTFLVYYLRAANTEPLQLLFFLGFLDRLARYRGSGFRAGREASLAWAYLLCLVLTKISFAALVPLTAAALLLARARLTHVVPGAALATLAVCTVNWVKFGGPFRTGYHWAKDALGFTHWPHEILVNFFLNEQWGIPTHFPLVLLALFGARRFWRAYRFDALFLLAVLCTFLLLVGSLPIWKGEWGYGPRYLLFLLPALGLPALPLLERLLAWRPGQGWKVPAAGALAGVVLAASGLLNMNVIRLDPFFVYWVGLPAKCKVPPETQRYFDTTHFGLITGEAWRKRQDLGTVSWVPPLASACSEKVLVDYVRRLDLWLGRTNSYWFSPRD